MEMQVEEHKNGGLIVEAEDDYSCEIIYLDSIMSSYSDLLGPVKSQTK